MNSDTKAPPMSETKPVDSPFLDQSLSSSGQAATFGYQGGGGYGQQANTIGQPGQPGSPFGDNGGQNTPPIGNAGQSMTQTASPYHQGAGAVGAIGTPPGAAGESQSYAASFGQQQGAMPGANAATTTGNPAGQQQTYPQPSAPGAPPPTYQQNAEYPQGQTYYQPPPATTGAQGPMPPTQHGGNAMMARVATFYNPPNRKTGMIRKTTSICCCFILIALIIGLASGLTTHSYNNKYYYCNTNAECTAQFGAGVFCYQGVCAR